MTQARARSEGSAIINEYEFDKTILSEGILTATDVEKSFHERNKEGGRQGAVSIRRKSINDGTAISNKLKRTIDESSNLKQTQRPGESKVPRRGRGRTKQRSRP